jgi:fructan beta-fructosidase
MNWAMACGTALLGLCLCAAADEARGQGEKAFGETYRPQFHYTARKGWINDPIGLVFYEGRYHLFNDHNPASCRFPGGRGSGEQSHWSHAVSANLMHWRHRPIAVFPDDNGACWSGSGVVDWKNTAGFQAGKDKALVLIYTSAGKKTFTQSLAYSTDAGRTWRKHRHNPVLEQWVGGNRDPKVFWHEPSGRWVMALYLRGHDYALLASGDLKQWTRLSELKHPGAGECPDLFELPILDARGRPIRTGKGGSRWIFWGANGTYLIGRFDGRTFTRQSGPHRTEWGPNCYAAQTWSDIPAADGRRLIIGWMRGGKFPGMPFNQQMTIPRVVTLRETEDGPRLLLQPVREIENVHGRKHAWSKLRLEEGDNPLAKLKGKLWDIDAVIRPGEAKQVGFDIRGERIAYRPKEHKLTALGSSAPLKMGDGRIKLRIVADVASIEVFANGGRVVMSFSLPIDPKNSSLSTFATGGRAHVDALTVWQCESAWLK